jgi:hypothetical protein
MMEAVVSFDITATNRNTTRHTEKYIVLELINLSIYASLSYNLEAVFQETDFEGNLQFIISLLFL